MPLPFLVKGSRRVPLYAALAAFVTYAFTLSRGITLDSLPLASKVAGWDWHPMTSQPLVWLLTLPLQCLPAGWVPTALNLLSAACGALTLGILARSIDLHPRERWLATKPWMRNLPTLVACVACGFEFSFWQEATAATGEMLDVLLIATLIWCLLEYRASLKLRWLDAAAVAWGLAAAENAVMFFTLPLFIAALIWLRREEFFEGPFLWRMALLGLAGISVYALLPLVNSIAPHSPWGLAESWRMSLRATRQSLVVLYIELGVKHTLLLVVVLAYFALPTLSWLLPSPDEGTAYQPPSERFQMFLYRTSVGLFFLACLWLAFDPSISPRHIVLKQSGLRLSLLSFDYVNALGAGFLAGSFMLWVQRRPGRQQLRTPWEADGWQIGAALKRLGVPALALLLASITVGLLARNAPALAMANRHPLEGFGELAVRSLPTESGIVLSDDPQRLAVFQAALSHRSESRRWTAVDATSLAMPEYRARLERQRLSGWLTAANRHRLSAVETRQLLQHVAETTRLYYLHSSFGAAFESFRLQPQKALYAMRLRPVEASGQLALPPMEVQQTEEFWAQVWQDQLASISAVCSPGRSLPSKLQRALSRRLYLKAIPARQSELLGKWYSAALESWGVELQRGGYLPEARVRFEQALALNTNNVAAQASLQCNAGLQSGKTMNLSGTLVEPAELGGAEHLSRIMSACGPFDDPVFCYALGRVCQQSGQLRQAVEHLERAQALAPGEFAPQFALARLYSLQRRDEKVLVTIAQLSTATASLTNRSVVDIELGMLEADAWLSQTNAARARLALEALMKEHPDDGRALSVAARAYAMLGDLTNALHLVTAQVAKEPNNTWGLVNEGGLLMKMGNPSEAFPAFDRALAITNAPEVQRRRALAFAQAENYRAAAKY